MAGELEFPNGINLDGSKAINVGTPTNSGDAVNKDYIDTKVVRSNYKLIKALADFPTPVSNVITLVDNTDYEINGAVNIGINQIKRGVSNKIYGVDKSNDKLIYTGTGAMFIDGANQDISVTFLTLANVTAGSTLFSWTGSTNNTQITDCIFGNCKSLGTITGGNIVVLNNNLITGCSAGITLSGTLNELVITDNLWFANISTIVNITIPSGTFSSCKISRNIMNIAITQTGLSLSDSVVVSGGCTVEICDFTGLGTYISGANFTSPVWRFTENRGIQNTLTFIPRAYDRSFFSVRATNSTRISSGITTSAFGSSASQNNDNNTNYTAYLSANTSGSFAGIESTSFIELRPNYSPIYSCVIKTDTALTKTRYWIGFISSTLINSDDQTGAYACFRYSSVAGDTGWRAIVDTGSVNTISANLGTVTVSTQYKFEIQMDFANSKTYFRINGGAWTVINSIIPSSTPLGLCAELVITSNGAKTLNFSRLDGNHY